MTGAKATKGKGTSQQKTVLGEIGGQVERFASKTIESVKKTIDKALKSRNRVLTIRVNDEANEKLSTLVDAGLFKSRSESAAFLIEEGIKHQVNLFNKISKQMEKIKKLQEELRGIISEEMSEEK